MPSEKSRYLNRAPAVPLNMNQLKTYLERFTHEHLVEIVWLSAQSSSALWKALSSSIAMILLPTQKGLTMVHYKDRTCHLSLKSTSFYGTH